MVEHSPSLSRVVSTRRIETQLPEPFKALEHFQIHIEGENAILRLSQEISPHVTGAFHSLGSIMQMLKLGYKSTSGEILLPYSFQEVQS